MKLVLFCACANQQISFVQVLYPRTCSDLYQHCSSFNLYSSRKKGQLYTKGWQRNNTTPIRFHCVQFLCHLNRIESVWLDAEVLCDLLTSCQLTWRTRVGSLQPPFLFSVSPPKKMCMLPVRNDVQPQWQQPLVAGKEWGGGFVNQSCWHTLLL